MRPPMGAGRAHRGCAACGEPSQPRSPRPIVRRLFRAKATKRVNAARATADQCNPTSKREASITRPSNDVALNQKGAPIPIPIAMFKTQLTNSPTKTASASAKPNACESLKIQIPMTAETTLPARKSTRTKTITPSPPNTFSSPLPDGHSPAPCFQSPPRRTCRHSGTRCRRSG